MGNFKDICITKYKIVIRFREEATSALAGFHAGPLSWSNWKLEMLVFVERGKPENPEKNLWSMARTNNKLNPYVAPGENRTQATLVGGEPCHHCTIHASDHEIQLDFFSVSYYVVANA